jgi:hypothetical protein
MVDNQHFIEATDFIKNTKKITFGQIALAIGIERHILDNIRRGSQAPNQTIIETFKRVYPESAKFFASKNQGEDIVNDSQDQVGYGEIGILKETLSVQKELIAMQRLRIAQLEIENEKLKNKQT